mmetsp:Transcript_85396/g.183006  ORF Transcript_85396/g.183006 Transcript_85396/m.183006 type:complete len:217 (-) Transcript_85396:2881-3531(-)
MHICPVHGMATLHRVHEVPQGCGVARPREGGPVAAGAASALLPELEGEVHLIHEHAPFAPDGNKADVPLVPCVHHVDRPREQSHRRQSLVSARRAVQELHKAAEAILRAVQHGHAEAEAHKAVGWRRALRADSDVLQVGRDELCSRLPGDGGHPVEQKVDQHEARVRELQRLLEGVAKTQAHRVLAKDQTRAHEPVADGAPPLRLVSAHLHDLLDA